MKKTDLLNFISRYHLAGATTSVKWSSDGSAVTTEFITDDQNVIGTTTTDSFNLGKSELGVYATPQLVKMLTAVSDDIDIDVNMIDDKAVNINIKDNDMTATFMLADLSVIRQVPDLKNTPDWNVSFDITKDFTNKFIKAKNAVPESENFAIKSSADSAEMIINYSSINNNRIRFGVDVIDASDMGIVCFSSNLFKEILVANKDAETGKMEVSEAGLARVTFESKTYKSTYYLVQLQAS